MDLPPPPPLFRHHPRYGNLPPPPDYIFQPYSHPLRPPPPLLPPPPLPPQHRQPYILPPPPPPPRHIAPYPMPPPFIFSSPSHPISVRSHTYGIDLPPEPYPRRNFFPPPPQETENLYPRITNRKPISEYQMIREGRSNIHELPDSRGRNLYPGEREFRGGLLDRGNSVIYDNFSQSLELYNGRYDMEGRNHNEIRDWGRDLYGERDYVSNRPRGIEQHKKMDYEGARQDSINGWIRGLYKDRDSDEGRRSSGVNDRGSKLYRESDDDGRRLNHGVSSARVRGGVSEGEFIMSKKRRLENGVATCRIQSGKDWGSDNGDHKNQHLMEGSRGKENEGSESLQARTDGKRVREKVRIQSGKDRGSDSGDRKNQHLMEGSRGSSSRGKENEGSESLQAKTDSKRVREKDMELAIQFRSNALVAEAVLAPPSSPTDNSSKDMVKTDLNACGSDSQPDSLGTSKELLDKAAISEIGSLEKDASDLGEVAVKNQGPAVLKSGTVHTCQNTLQRNKELLQETNMEIRKDSDEISNANDCIISSSSPQPCSVPIDLGESVVKNKDQEDMKLQPPAVMRKDTGEIAIANGCIIPSASPQPCSAPVGLGEIAVKNQPQEDMNAHSPTVGSGSTRGKEWKARKKLDIACSSQVSRCSPEIQPSIASSESLSALLLKPQNAFISDAGSADASSKEAFLNELNIPLVVYSEDLDPAMEIDFIGEKGSSKEIGNSSGELSKVEVSTMELDFDANGSSPSFRKREVTSPISNLSPFLEDVVMDGLNSVCSNHHQLSSGLAEGEIEKREDLSFSSNNEASACQSENEMICGEEYVSNKDPVSSDLNLFPSEKSLLKVASENTQIKANLSHSLPEVSNEVAKKTSLVHGKQTLNKSQLISASPKVFPSHHPLHSNYSKKQPSTPVVKSRTWHRNGSSSVGVADKKLKPSPLSRSLGTKTAQTALSAQTTQGSYIRKGNSLVRTPSPSAVTSGFRNLSCSVYRLPHCTENLKTDQASDSQTGDADALSLLRTKLENTSETPCKMNDASVEHKKSPGASECQLGSVNRSITHGIHEEGNLKKKMVYIKKRSNQLVAASNSDDMSISGVNKTQASSSAGYFKSNKNQLVRSSSENHVKKRDANRNSRRLVPRTILPRTSIKRQSGDFVKSYRNSKFSLVWNLHDIQSLEKDKTSVGPQKIFPLIPWKRTSYWRSFMHALGTKPKKSSLSIASQTLLPSRKRGAMYTRSTHGYSLTMSKVLSVGGSSLKWSKSIERDSKKVNEDATRAVAAAVKRKKEGNGAVPTTSKGKNNVSSKFVLSVKLHPGERIFRIGTERYKMDPSRRTLHRITAEPEPPSVPPQSKKNVKRSYIPKRLLIGNEEYVRIGNGNQLVRDPKKRTRVLASEKVRWSLHTARLRLARKKKYCQFFTRYGKCNKDDGKCPYVHDPSKIAVCTKFLNGLCNNVDCKLTHKVIPERMEDCSYFLKGSCSNEKCPYRHVIVNSKSAVCKNFLRGHCAEGNECQKKHTYMCPTFEATGSCPKEATCKLHHPKKKIEKRQPASEQKSVRGRYFDGGLIGDADISDVSAGKVSVNGKEDVCFEEGQFPDYISLKVSSDTEDTEEQDMEEQDTEEEQDDFDVLV